ncbi:vWA domain-containing protein [Phytomonospora sp. NPDC050363]|uniref:vWA domain-containing protein n=1 Tax=Phytomonospora sp. NPDC050363 TaxID=3155642 RepID=UPI00340F6565
MTARRPPRWITSWNITAAAGAATALGVLSQGLPSTFLAWVFLLGATVAAMAVGYAGYISLAGPDPDADDGAPKTRRGIPPGVRRAIPPAVMVVSLAVLLYLVIVPIGVGARLAFLAVGCSAPAEIRVLTSDESHAAVDALAAAYEARADHNGCRTAHLTAYSASWPQIREGFQAGWTGDPLRELGPRPDVWIAESRDQYERVAAEMAALGVTPAPIAAAEPFAYTPLVLGVPNPQATALEANTTGLPLTGLLNAATRAGLEIVRPDPSVSYSGLRHTEALYRHLAEPNARRSLEQRLGADADRGGYPLGDESAVLCHRRSRPDDTTSAAMLLTERALVRYNSGQAVGAGCPLPAAPVVRLTAFYPPVGDLPGELPESLDYTAVRWPSADETTGGPRARATAAEGFAAWLNSEEATETLTAQGLRPADGDVGRYGSDPLPGARTDAGFLRGAWRDPGGVPLAQRLDTTLRSYTDARRRTRVLLAVDTSGSMSAEVDEEGRSGLEVATTAISAPLPLLGPRDAFGLWTFPGQGTEAHTEIMPVSGVDDPAERGAELSAALEAHGTGGRDSPLYRTIGDGIGHLAESGADTLPVLVVFTDGVDTSADPDVDAAIEAARSGGVRVFIVTVGDAACAGTPMASIADVSAGSCLDAEFETVGERLAGLFLLLWGGRTDGT